jgi:ribonucleotide monophosphatase NagD (HAD superfamily)
MVGDTLYTDIAFGNACGVRSGAANSGGPGGPPGPLALAIA